MEHIKQELIRETAVRVREIEQRALQLGPEQAAKDDGLRRVTGFHYKKGSNKASFNGVITSQTLNYAKTMMEDMEDHDEIHLTINSPGGSAITGVALFNLLNNADQHVTATASGQAYSAAGVMMQGADERLVAPGSYIGVHRSWCNASGNEEDFLKLTKDLRKSDQNILGIFGAVAKPGKLGKIKEYMEEDTALDGDQAVEVGLADRVLTPKETKSMKAKVAKPEIKNEAPETTDEILARVDATLKLLVEQKDEEIKNEQPEEELTPHAAEIKARADKATEQIAKLTELAAAQSEQIKALAEKISAFGGEVNQAEKKASVSITVQGAQDPETMSKVIEQSIDKAAEATTEDVKAEAEEAKPEVRTSDIGKDFRLIGTDF